jgi:hypothetical protein
VTRDTSRPPPELGFWDSLGGALTIIGLIAVVTVIVLLRSSQDPPPPLVVEVSSCIFEGSAVKVGLAVRNTGTESRPAHVEVEYRDSNGKKVGTDSGTTRPVAPGETVRITESAALDTPLSSGTCEITEVR